MESHVCFLKYEPYSRFMVKLSSFNSEIRKANFTVPVSLTTVSIKFFKLIECLIQINCVNSYSSTVLTNLTHFLRHRN